MIENLFVKVKKCSPNAKIPSRSHDSDAGYDLYALDHTIIEPMQRKMVRTGIAIELAPGTYGRIAPRSGLALKQGIHVLGGVVDAGYRNEINVILLNTSFDIADFLQPDGLFGSKNRLVINPGDRIAQLIIEKCYSVKFMEASELNSSERDLAGFGSTGK